MTESATSRREQISSLKRTILYKPLFTGLIIGFSFFATLLEGIGLSFLFPIIEAAQANGAELQQTGGIAGMFLRTYSYFGVPFTLEFMLLGVTLVMIVRYSSTFVAKWLAVKLNKDYEQSLKQETFRLALEAEVKYYDEKGSDDILNAIITQTRYAGKLIKQLVKFFQQVLLSLMYLGIAIIVAPYLTIIAGITLGGITYIVRYVLEPGYTIGDQVATANEEIQEQVQAGTQGIRDVKMYGMTENLYESFIETVDTYNVSSVELERNKVGINSFYELSAAIVLFGMLYVAIAYLSLSIAALGVFLFAMFRLAPRISMLSSQAYNIEGNLPHLVRTHRFVDELSNKKEDTGGSNEAPEKIESVAFDNVRFSYTEDEQVLRGVSFEVNSGEFIGFVGQSGAGKSTIVSLIARMYDPDEGRILANGVPIDEFDLRGWRDKIAMVRQKPFIFNDTLRYNMTMGSETPQQEIERVAGIAKVDEFLNHLPKGFDTVLGDDGVKLSGGQRQRVALARALLADDEILVLDEATSDLDSHLEREIHEAIEELAMDRTIIAIAHRLSTVQNADCIYTIDDGQIIEQGEHKELLENGKIYSRLHEIQS